MSRKGVFTLAALIVAAWDPISAQQTGKAGVVWFVIADSGSPVREINIRRKARSEPRELVLVPFDKVDPAWIELAIAEVMQDRSTYGLPPRADRRWPVRLSVMKDRSRISNDATRIAGELKKTSRRDHQGIGRVIALAVCLQEYGGVRDAAECPRSQ